MINREEYSSTLTKLKRIQRENEKLRESLEITKREADHWEKKAKQFLVLIDTCETELKKAQAELKLWQGTGV